MIYLRPGSWEEGWQSTGMGPHRLRLKAELRRELDHRLAEMIPSARIGEAHLFADTLDDLFAYHEWVVDTLVGLLDGDEVLAMKARKLGDGRLVNLMDDRLSHLRGVKKP